MEDSATLLTTLLNNATLKKRVSDFGGLVIELLYPVRRPVSTTITLYPIGRPVSDFINNETHVQ